MHKCTKNIKIEKTQPVHKPTTVHVQKKRKQNLSFTWRRHAHVSPTCRTDAGSGPPPPNSLTFRPVVGQLSEVVPFLLLEQRCGIACQAMLRRPRRCRCSRTGLFRRCYETNFQLHSPFLVIISHPRTVVLAIVFIV